MQILSSFSPGQTITIFQEVIDINGQRTNDGYVPVVTRIILPGFTVASGYPQHMTQLDTGLYYFQFTLPTGAVAIGSYLIDVVFLNPINSVLDTQAFQIICLAPSGNYGITTF